MQSEVAERGNPTVTLAVLMVACLAYAVLSSIILPALPTLRQDLNASENGIVWVLTGYLLSASVGTGILGRLGDIFGKEHVLVGTLVVLAAGAVLAAIVHTLPLLIAARVVQGIGGGIFPLSFGIVRDEFPAHRVAGGIGFVSSTLGIGGAFGIVVGSLISEYLNWQWLFWVPLAVIVPAAFCAWRFIPESPVRARVPVNWLAAALLSIGLASVLIAVSEATAWGWASAKTLTLFAVGGAVLAAWVTVEIKSEQPLIDMGMMRVRGVWASNIAGFMLGAGSYGLLVVFPQLAQLPKSTGFGYGSSILASAFYLLPQTVGTVAATFASGAIATRYGSKRPATVGSLITVAAFAMIALQYKHPYDMIISGLIFGVGVGLAYAALGNLVVQAVDFTQTGAAGGVNAVLRLTGSAIGGQLAATFVAAHIAASGLPTETGFVETFVFGAVLMLICAIASMLVPDQRVPRYVPALAD